MTLRQRILVVLLLLATVGAALAQTRGGALTIRSTMLSPLIALLAGVVGFVKTDQDIRIMLPG